MGMVSFSPSHLPVVGERYHAFPFQATQSEFGQPCAVILFIGDENMHIEETTRKTLLFFLIMAAFVSVSLACNLPRSLVDRDDFACTEAGGKWVVENGKTRCEFDPSVDDESSKSEANQNQIPAGTYIGTVIDTEMATRGLVEWQVQGNVEKNEVIIHVAGDGSVTGDFFYEKIGNILLSDDGGGSHAACIDSNDQFFVGKASGMLTGNTGRVVFAIQQTIVSRLTEGCSIGPKERTIVKDHRQLFQIEINGSEMYGTSILSDVDGHPVKATFRLDKQ
jgi:hypothetical protein